MSDKTANKNALTSMVKHLGKDRIESCLNKPSAFEGATIGGLHYLLLYTFNTEKEARFMVKHIHFLGFGARVSSWKGGVTRSTYYGVYVRRNKR